MAFRLNVIFKLIILIFMLQNLFIMIHLLGSDNHMPIDSSGPPPTERREARNVINKLHDKEPKENEPRAKLYDDDIFFSPHDENWDMPKWIKDYITFHREARRKYPGKELFTTNDTNAPKILVRICPGICGGLNDRLGNLPTDLHVANMTNRVLFIHWAKPVPIETLLTPNLIDFVVPQGIGYEQQRDVLAKPKFPVCWKIERDCEQMDEAIHQAIHGPESKERVLTFMWVQHINETATEARLKALGETDMIHNTPSYGQIFWSFFKLNPEVKKEVIQVKNQFKLHFKSYSLLHARVRHPRGLNPGNKILFQSKTNGKTIDQGGFNFTNPEARSFALGIITHAMQCSRLILKGDEPLYFISDSEDLVNYITNELSEDESMHDKDIQSIRSTLNIISRNLSIPNLHIDRQKRFPTYYYYPTIIDLVLAANARCIVHGVGRYTSLAARISNNHCLVQHRENVWGAGEHTHSRVCTEANYSR